MTIISKFRKTLKSDSGEINIGLSHDSLNAFLTIIPKNKDRLFDVREVLELLDVEGIVNGLKRNRISDLVSQVNDTHVPIKDELIAHGTASIPGQDAQVKHFFKTSKSIELTADEDGKVDHKELNLINNVENGELLAEKIPPVEPVPGTDIYGEKIEPTPVKDTRLVVGQNVRLSEDEMKCYSSIDGQVFLKNRMINVSPVYMVPHDVDLNVGNITFNGSIVVNGNVLSGFTLKAKENISVKGTVEGATLIAGGTINCMGGVKGMGKASLQCKGDFNGNFVERATIEAHGNVIITNSAVNSEITSYSKVIMLNNKGQIIGGEIRAIQGIECLEAGSKLGVCTRLVAGDKFIIRQRINETTGRMQEAAEELKKLILELKEKEPLLQKLNSLPPDKKTLLLEIQSKKEELTTEVKTLKAKLDKLNQLFALRTDADVKIRKTTHGNTIIIIGHSTLEVKSNYMHTRFVEDPMTKRIKPGPIPSSKDKKS